MIIVAISCNSVKIIAGKFQNTHNLEKKKKNETIMMMMMKIKKKNYNGEEVECSL